MKYKRSIKTKVLSLFLSVVMSVTLLPTTAFATGTEQTQEITETDVSEEAVGVTESASEELSEENAIIEESTENSKVFDLGNGKKTVVYYGQDVRFEEDGELLDYDPALVKVEDKASPYKYENKAGDSKQYFPEKLEGDSQILMEKGEYSIKMLPLDLQIQNEEVVLRKEVT